VRIRLAVVTYTKIYVGFHTNFGKDTKAMRNLVS